MEDLDFYFVEAQETVSVTRKKKKPLLEQVLQQNRLAKKSVSSFQISDRNDVEEIISTTTETTVQCYSGNLLNIAVKLLRIRTGQPLDETITEEDQRAAFQYITENPNVYYYDTLYGKAEEQMFLANTTSYSRPLRDAQQALIISSQRVYTFEDLQATNVEFFKKRCLPECLRVEYTAILQIQPKWVDGEDLEPIEVEFKVHESMLHPPRYELGDHDAFVRYSVYDEASYDPNLEWDDVYLNDINDARQHIQNW